MKSSLVRNFGFKNDGTHILVLKNEAATRRGLINAFRSQLTVNAKKHPNGLFLFYYSGHGSQTFDANGDEALLDPTDKLDETLVTFDSTRDPKDRTHFDLVDDDIHVLYDELQRAPRFSGQLVSIFDSCHSGTATRSALPLGDPQRRIKGLTADSRIYPEDLGLKDKGLTADSRRYPGKGVTTDARLSPGIEAPRQLPHLNNYVAFAGSMSSETSEERLFPEVVNGREVKRPHGALTYYLLQAMEGAAQKTTNGEIWQRVSQALNRFNQSPQLEGVTNYPFLGGGTRSEVLPITYTRTGNTLTITRGVEAGAVKGGFVELFAVPKTTPKGTLKGINKGTSKALPSATRSPLGCLPITSAGVGRSKVVVPASFKGLSSLPTKGTVQLLTPYFGQQPLRVGLGDLSGGPVAGRLREFTQNNNFVQLAAPDEMADVTVVASTYGEAFPQGRPVELKHHPANERGYFVSVRPGDPPLFSAWFKALSDGDIAVADEYELRKALDNFAAQSNIIALSNTSAGTHKLGQAVRFEVFKVPGKMDGKIFVSNSKASRRLKADARGGFAVKDQDRIEFHLSNQTDERVYISLLWLSQDGSITAIADVNRRKIMVLKPKNEAGSTAKTSIYRINPPFGSEDLKLLVSSQPINATVLERDRVLARNDNIAPAPRASAPVRPFDMIMGQALNTRGPIPKDASNIRFDGWAVGEFRLTIGAGTVRKP